MRFEVSSHIAAPPSVVWELLLDWEGSAAWMVDATTVRVVGEQRTGVGTRIEAVTRVAGVPLTDRMEVVAWEEGRLIEVMHRRPPIVGPARFLLAPEGNGTRMTWEEDLVPPLGKLGEIGARVLRRPIEALLAKSLQRLRRIAEARA